MLGDELDGWKRRLEVVDDDDAFVPLWTAALPWLAHTNAARLDELLTSSTGVRYRAVFAPFQRRYLTLMENAVTKRLFALEQSGDADLEQLLAIPFARQTYDRVEEALDLVDFDDCRLFVNIGCGPFPAAALLIHGRTAVQRIIAVDNDAAAIKVASRVIRRLASPRLEVLHADGTGYDFGTADVIYIARRRPAGDHWRSTPCAAAAARIIASICRTRP